MPSKDNLSRTCGFVDVEEKEKSSKFMRRYLRLDKAEGVVEWFMDNPANLPENAHRYGSIDINFITKVYIPAKAKLRAKHCYVIDTPMRKYYFQANDESDMEEWVEALNNASKIVVSSDDEMNQSSLSLDQVSIKSLNPPEEYCYKTEIVAGVVVQKRMSPEISPAAQSKDEDSKSQTSVSNGSPRKLKRNPIKPIKDGWGVKQGHVRKNWKRRYFVLTTAGFSYFRSDHVKDAIRFVPLSEILTAKKDETALSEHKENLFFVATTERIYYIQVDSVKEMMSWIKSFHDAIHYSSSLKRRSKDEKSSGNGPGTPQKISSTLTNCDAAFTFASQSHRNPSHLVGTSTTRNTPITSSRLLSSNKASYQSLIPSKSRTIAKPGIPPEWWHATSNSEESGGLYSTVEPMFEAIAYNQEPEKLTPANDAELRINNVEEKLLETEAEERAFYKKPISGAVVSMKTKSAIPDTDSQREDERSLPLIQPIMSPEASVPPCASFSVASNRTSGSFSSTNSARSSKSFNFDPEVDHRAAVKPSTCKKKRNTGILFSLNNMLNKKAEKMNSAERKRIGL